MLSPELLEIVRCPETMQRLSMAPPELLDRLNAGPLSNRSGNPATLPLEGGLLREDGTVLYPIVHGIPVLLIDEAVVIPQGARGW
jgi:uncharacterized protein